MQIFTTEMIIQMYAQSRELVHAFVGALMSTTWQNIMVFFPTFMEALVAKDWSEMLIRLLVLLSSVVIIYRLMRNVPFVALKSILDI